MKTIGEILILIFIVVYAIGFIENSIETTMNIIDAWENGFPIFREDYIPPSKRKIEGVKFVPPGEDPDDYSKS